MLIISGVCFQKYSKFFQVKVDVEEGALRFRDFFWALDVLVSSSLHSFIVIICKKIPQWLLCPFFLGFAFGF